MLQNRYDLIVVGCGFCGGVIARLAAEQCGKRVLLLERRDHIAGNMYDEFDANGILVQKYGPHIFHTDEDWIYQFISRFANWYSYHPFSTAELDGKLIPVPFSFKSIQKLYPGDKDERLIARLKREYPGRQSISVLELMESADTEISAFGEMLFEKDFRPYAAKQWNLDPKELDRSVVERMPIILSDEDYSFGVKYELLPEQGFTAFFQNMLDHENIDILLNTDACAFLRFDFEKGVCFKDAEKVTIPIAFTGALEDIFNSQNPLPYRSLWFDYQTMDTESYQQTVIQTYPQTHAYLRSTEFTKMMKRPPAGKTVVAFEYPVPYQKGAERGNEPYYPILTKENVARKENYLRRLAGIPNVVPCGRLADYKYYNMDQAVMRAFEIFAFLQETFFGGKKEI